MADHNTEITPQLLKEACRNAHACFPRGYDLHRLHRLRCRACDGPVRSYVNCEVDKCLCPEHQQYHPMMLTQPFMNFSCCRYPDANHFALVCIFCLNRNGRKDLLECFFRERLLHATEDNE